MPPHPPHLHIIENDTISDEKLSDDTEFSEKNWVIQVENISKRFDIYQHDRNRVYEFFGNRSHHQEHWSLKNLNFSIAQGECFGIVGANGAGKSTFLKILSGITAPSEGEIRIRADISTLLDLGLGFHPAFSGRENIRLNCKLLGMKHHEITEAIPKIIQFAELGDFIDFPVRTYSSGMQLRLGFAIAVHAPSDVLLIDEVLTVGDQRFQRKCVQKIEEFLQEQKTIILVSHDLHAIRSLCDRVLWLDKGSVVMLGKAEEVVDRYIQGQRSTNTAHQPIVGPFVGATHTPPQLPHPSLSEYSGTLQDPTIKNLLAKQCAIENSTQIFNEHSSTLKRPVDIVDGNRAVAQGTGEIHILQVQILDKDAQQRQRFHTGEDIIVAVDFTCREVVEHPIFGVAIFRDDLYIHGPNTHFDGVLEKTYHGVYTFCIRWKNIPLLTGAYKLSVAIFDKHHLKPHIWHNQLYALEIASNIEDHGLILLEHDWAMFTHYENLETTPSDTKPH